MSQAVSETELRQELEQQAGPVKFSDLKHHLERGVVFWVSAELDLLDVAVVLARDDAAQLGRWVESAKVARPGVEELDLWKAGKSVLTSAIVRPWVLVQEAKGGTVAS